MKSVAAYYVFVAMNSQEQDTQRRHAQHARRVVPPLAPQPRPERLRLGPPRAFRRRAGLTRV